MAVNPDFTFITTAGGILAEDALGDAVAAAHQVDARSGGLSHTDALNPGSLRTPDVLRSIFH